MVFLETVNKDVTIDQLIRVLQEAKAELPNKGKTKVLLSVEDDFHSIGAITADFAEGKFPHWEWTGDPEEDEDMGDETVLSLISCFSC